MRRFGDVEVYEAGEFRRPAAPPERPLPGFSFGDAGSIEQNFGVVNNYAAREPMISRESKSSAVRFVNFMCTFLLMCLLGLMVAFLVLAYFATG